MLPSTIDPRFECEACWNLGQKNKICNTQGEEEMNMVYKFYSLAEKRVITMPKSKSGPDPDAVCVGSSHDWVAFINRRGDCDLFLCNPITGRNITLPSIRTLPVNQKDVFHNIKRTGYPFIGISRWEGPAEYQSSISLLVRRVHYIPGWPFVVQVIIMPAVGLFSTALCPILKASGTLPRTSYSFTGANISALSLGICMILPGLQGRGIPEAICTNSPTLLGGWSILHI